MGSRVLKFSLAHPDAEPGMAKLERLLGRADGLAPTQRDGLIQSHGSWLHKRDMRRSKMAVAIAHLAEVGNLAARDDHALGTTFRFKPDAGTQPAFRTAVRSMVEVAETH